MDVPTFFGRDGGYRIESLLGGRSDRNIRFADLRRILLSLNFNERITGGHHIFSRQGIAEIVNLQPLSGGKAKPYQVKQVRAVLTSYGLAGESEPEESTGDELTGEEASPNPAEENHGR